jgi:LacI family transcriptional regulator, galactose operon repressor
MATKRNGPARLDDVAREAGVHASTVSRILNQRSDAPFLAETRERVIDAAERLNYRPHALARALKMATTRAIGLLVPSLRNPLWSEIIHGAFDGAWSRNYVLLLQEDSGDSRAAEAYRRLVSEGRIDGVLLLNATPGSAFVDQLLRDSIPTVFANRALPGSGRNVVMDEGAGIEVALRHIAEAGHHLVAHIDGEANIETSVRRVAAAETLARDLELSLSIIRAPVDEHGGFEAMTRVLALEPRPTACVISTINQVVGAAYAAFKLENPPYLLSYDEEPILDYLPLPVTSLTMPLYELGFAAALALIAQIDGSPASDVVVETKPLLNFRPASA